MGEVKKKKRSGVIALLDNVRSLYNVGAIFRTSEAVMLEKLYLCGITGAPPRKEITKTALGAEEIVPFEYRESAVEVVRELKAEGVKIVAVELCEDSVPYDELEVSTPVCFIFGHEVEGISDELMEEVDASVSLPMLGRANSLNVATCYGIMMYEILKKINYV